MISSLFPYRDHFPFGIPKTSASFVPTDDSNLRVWGDFSQRVAGLLTTTPVGSTPVTNGLTVGRFFDRSANAFNHTQSSAGARPLWFAGAWNGLGMIFPDGGDFLDFTSQVVADTACTLYYVCLIQRTSFPGPDSTIDTVWTSGNTGSVSFASWTYNSFLTTASNQIGADSPLDGGLSVNSVMVTSPFAIPGTVTPYIVATTRNTSPGVGGNSGSRVAMFRDGLLGGVVAVGEFFIVQSNGIDARYINYLNSFWSVF